MNCLDSSFLVDFLDSESAHHEDAVAWMDRQSAESNAVPAICAFEVLRGSVRAGDERFDRAVAFLRTLTVLELTLEGTIAAGKLDGDRHAAGEPLGPRDTLVASAARENGATLVTRDRDFEQIPNLDIVLYDG